MTKGKKTPAKTPCPISRKEFKEKARPIAVTINGQVFAVNPKKELDEGSLGFFLNDKVTVMVGDVPVKLQVGLNLTVINSKDLPATTAAAA